MIVYRGSDQAQDLFIRLWSRLSVGLTRLRVSHYMTGVHTPGSQHPLGTAVDLGIRTAAERAHADELARRWKSIGLTAIREPDHWHLQLFSAGQNSLVLRA